MLEIGVGRREEVFLRVIWPEVEIRVKNCFPSSSNKCLNLGCIVNGSETGMSRLILKYRIQCLSFCLTRMKELQ